MIKEKVYKSKFGWSLFLFMTVLYSVVLWISYSPEKGENASLLLFLIAITTLGLFTWMSLGTHYTITDTYLHIISKPFHNKKIAIASIKKIEVSRNLMSSPAPSLDRIEIYYEKYNSIVISPKDKFQFMDDLKKINPAIVLVKSF